MRYNQKNLDSMESWLLLLNIYSRCYHLSVWWIPLWRRGGFTATIIHTFVQFYLLFWKIIAASKQPLGVLTRCKNLNYAIKSSVMHEWLCFLFTIYLSKRTLYMVKIICHTNSTYIIVIRFTGLYDCKILCTRISICSQKSVCMSKHNKTVNFPCIGCVTCWCPWITFGRNAEIIDRGTSCK